VSGGWPRCSATTAAQSVRTGARLTLMEAGLVMVLQDHPRQQWHEVSRNIIIGFLAEQAVPSLSDADNARLIAGHTNRLLHGQDQLAVLWAMPDKELDHRRQMLAGPVPVGSVHRPRWGRKPKSRTRARCGGTRSSRPPSHGAPRCLAPGAVTQSSHCCPTRRRAVVRRG
jgi:hypothetical protein